MKRRVAALILLPLAVAQHAWSASIPVKATFPDSMSPGQNVEIQPAMEGLTFGASTTSIAVLRLVGVPPSPAPEDHPIAGNVAKEGKAIQIPLPNNIAPGRYYLTLSLKSTPPSPTDFSDQVMPGEIRVQRDAVKLDSTHPATAYKNRTTQLFDFDVIGENFSKVPTDDQVLLAGRGPIVPEPNRAVNADGCKNKAPCFWVESPRVIHVVGYTAERYQGPLSLSVVVGSVTSKSVPLVLSRMSETGVFLWTVGIFGVMGWIVYRLVARGVKDYLIHGKRYSPFFAFFLDKETNSYSLSKFQFLLFSAAFVFGYLYVFLCRWLVQWQFVLPDVPSNFSGILAVSAGTAVAAAGATSARGSKGAGAIHPSAADFISTGGLVVPERFQFFVWSIVACFGFIALLISQDPSTISGFPNFPDGLLYIMGVSSAGYLGGKLTRKPGPVIRNMALKKKTPQAAAGTDEALDTLIVQGENLSRDADFYVDEHKLGIDTDNRKELVKATDQADAADRTFSSELRVAIAAAANLELTSGDHNFRIMNRDGQSSDARFTSDSPKITTVTMADAPLPQAAPGAPPIRQINSGKGPVPILVKGEGFRAGTMARWTPAGSAEATELTSSAVEFVDANTLKVTLTPADPGTGTLLIVTPNGFSALASSVNVVAP